MKCYGALYVCLAVFLQCFQVAGQFITATTNSAGKSATLSPSPVPTVDPWFMDNLKNGLKEFLDSVYPAIAAIDTITLPNTIIIDGSPYRIPAIALQTTSSSATSTSSTTSPSPSSISSQPTSTPSSSGTTSGISNAAATNTPAHSSGTHNDRRLGIILGVVLGVVALAILLLILCLASRRRRRSGYWLKHEKPYAGAEVAAQPKHRSTRTWMGDNSTITKIWSPKEKEPLYSDSYSPVEGQRPNMKSKPGHSKFPFLAGLFAGRASARSGRDGLQHGSRTPPQHDAVDAVAADGPFARATSAEGGYQRHSFYGDHTISPVPNPYELSGADQGHHGRALPPVAEEHFPSSDAALDDAEPIRRVPTPLMHGAFASAATDADHGVDNRPYIPDRSPSPHRDFVRPKSIAGSTRSSILRKPVPPPINTTNLAQDQSTNPFASSEDPYVDRTSGGSPYSQSASAFRDQRGDDYSTRQVPMVPPRSPERRYSPKVYAPGGIGTGGFDFGLPRG